MQNWLIWIPRVAAVAVALFIGFFALDAIDEGLLDFLRHLAPTFVLLLVVAVAWRHEYIGAIAFCGLAVLYAWGARRWDWILVISGPLATVGLLYFCAWWAKRGPQRFAVTRGSDGGTAERHS